MRNILVIGGGGREHALAWALARSPRVRHVYVAPGNAGTEWPANPNATGLAPRASASRVPIAPDDFDALIAFAREHDVYMAVVGPEAPLAAGIVDAFQQAGVPIFGPSQAAAQIEASKAFAKAFMEQTGIPTAAHAAFTDYDAARAYLRQHPAPVVVKASGLAAGKGVIVCETQEEAEAALRMIMVDRAFGAAGDVVVIEEFLQGPEVSVLAFSDGRTVKRMPPARDHKRIYEGDRGPNTGGMGAFAPPPDVDEALLDEIEATILRPAVQGMLERGTPYVGVLYAGLMLTQDGPKVLEFNCRFGDPETQAILLLLESDLLDVFEACLAGRLDETNVQWRDGAAATIVLASPGYPGAYPKGLPIEGVERAAAHENVVVFHAGTARDEAGRLVTAGGRVLNVSAYDADLERALQRAYAAVEEIAFEGMQYRRDIGKTVVEEQ